MEVIISDQHLQKNNNSATTFTCHSITQLYAYVLTFAVYPTTSSLCPICNKIINRKLQFNLSDIIVGDTYKDFKKCLNKRGI